MEPLRLSTHYTKSISADQSSASTSFFVARNEFCSLDLKEDSASRLSHVHEDLDEVVRRYVSGYHMRFGEYSP